MVSIFRERNTFSFFFLAILSIVLHLPFFLHPPEIMAGEKSGLLSYWLVYLKDVPSIGVIVLYHLIVVVQALRLNYILNDLRMFQKYTSIPAMLYVLLVSFFPAWANISPALICNILTIWLLLKITRLYNATNPKTAIYNVGLIAGSIAILYQPGAMLALFSFCALATLRPFNLREWFVLLLGLITPVYFLLVVLFLTDNLTGIHDHLLAWGPHLVRPQNFYGTIVAASLGGLLILAGFFTWEANSKRMLIQIRKMWTLVLLMLILMMAISFVCYNPRYEAALLSVIPIAAYVSNFFLYVKKKWIAELFFWIIIGVIFYNNWENLRIVFHF